MPEWRGDGDNGEESERVIKEHVQRTYGQNQRGLGLRVGGGDGWDSGSAGGKVEITVFEQQQK